MSLDSCIFLDNAAPRLYQSFTLDSYPAEGDQEALVACHAFVREWDGHTALALLCSRCRAPGKTGLMIGVYKALLPRVQADLQHGAWVHMLEFAGVAEDPHQRFGPVAERAYPAGVLVLDDLAAFALREPARHQLERLLRYRTQQDLPTFFIADSLDLVRERAGAAIAALLLARCTVVDIFGPNLHRLMGARRSPEQAAMYPDWYDAYEYLRNAQRAEEEPS